MIFDSLKNKTLYEALGTKFVKAFAFVERAEREDLPIGRYEIDGDAIFANIQEYETKQPENAPFEAHRRYIDIQYIQRGQERMILTSPAHTSPITEYSEEKDVAFFADHDAPVDCIVHAGEFGIFFPQDIHKPGLAFGGTPSPVKKILVKIEL